MGWPLSRSFSAVDPKLLGHASTATTQRYTPVEGLAAMVAAIGD
jgi:site-specific recombinase XerD